MPNFFKLFVALVLSTCFAVSNAATYDFEQNGIYLKVLSLDDMTVSVVTGDHTYEGDIVIPTTVEYNGKTFTVTEIADHTFSSSKINSIILPSKLTTIKSYAFNNTNLTAIELPNSLTTIGNSAFSFSSIEYINLPNNVTSMGNYAFQGCSKLKTAIIGDGLTYVSPYAFSNCYILEDVKFGNSLKSLNTNAFENCKRLSEVKLPASLKYITTACFSGCERLSKVVLSDNLEKINNHAFQSCVKLEDIIIPNNVLEIGSDAFRNCSKLKKVTLGSKLEKIGSDCFKSCTALQEIVSLNPEPPVCKEFENKQYMDVTVRVPKNALEIYKETEPWKNFWKIETLESSAVISTEIDSKIIVKHGSVLVSEEIALQGIQVYDINGMMVYSGHDVEICNLPNGIYLIHTSNGVVKVSL